MLLNALQPLHDAIRKAINKTMKRVRESFPEMASDLTSIGEFECIIVGSITLDEMKAMIDSI